MYYVLALLADLIIAVGVYFVCSWFSKKTNDRLDIASSIAFMWPIFPIVGMFVIIYDIVCWLEHIRNKMLEYKVVRERRRLEIKHRCHIIDEKIAVSSHAPKVGARLIYNDDNHMLEPSIKVERDPLLLEAEQEVEQLLNERKL